MKGRAPGKSSRSSEVYGDVHAAAPSTEEQSRPASGTAPGKRTLVHPIYRKASGSPRPTADRAQLVERAQQSAGSPLSPQLQQQWDTSFSMHKLPGDVQLHTGAESDAAGNALGARAFATGSHIHFADGQSGDPELLGHELAHVVQQNNSAEPTPQAKLEVSQPGDPLEQEADRAGPVFARGEVPSVPITLSAAPATIARDKKNDAAADDKLSPNATLLFTAFRDGEEVGSWEGDGVWEPPYETRTIKPGGRTSKSSASM